MYLPYKGKTEYLVDDDVQQLNALFYACEEMGITTVDCNASCPEDEFENYPTNNFTAFINDIDGGAEDFQIDLWNEKRMIGTVWVVLYNRDYTAFYDYSWRRGDDKAEKFMDDLHNRIRELLADSIKEWEIERYGRQISE